MSKKMKIGIIGAGFTGLTAALRLSQKGHKVIIFEKEGKAGGLAFGYKKPKWEWPLEAYYHHWFTNDDAVLTLAKELSHPILTIRPRTSVYKNGVNYQLDSPISLLKYERLTIPDKIRMGLVLAFFKTYPNYKKLEQYRAVPTLTRLMGLRAFREIWEPQFENKFKRFTQDISLSWFWARVVKRTPSLCYPEGGYEEFINTIVIKLKTLNVKLLLNTPVDAIRQNKSKNIMVLTQNQKYTFDKVIVTVPNYYAVSLIPDFPEEYKRKLTQIKEMGTVTLILRLKNQFLKDGTYWLSIGEKDNPPVIVEHTNFIDKKQYNNEHLLYIGNYLSHDHELFKLSASQLLQKYDGLLNKINKNYRKQIIGIDVFKSYGTQPIVVPYYSKLIPAIGTPINGIYLANSSQVYPWDRGTNYAVEMGERVADRIIKSEDPKNLRS
jgi:protoporphyrinogen oxidase